MPSLAEAIAAKRKEKRQTPCSFEETFSPGPVLLLKKWDGESWVIPWSRLARIRCTSEGIDASLELTFDHLSVAIYGHNLADLLKDLGACKISCLRELPTEYRSMLCATEPFVIRIDLTDMNPQNGPVSFSGPTPAPTEN
jgi:hypothetical protein